MLLLERVCYFPTLNQRSTREFEFIYLINSEITSHPQLKPYIMASALLSLISELQHERKIPSQSENSWFDGLINNYSICQIILEFRILCPRLINQIFLVSEPGNYLPIGTCGSLIREYLDNFITGHILKSSGSPRLCAPLGWQLFVSLTPGQAEAVTGDWSQ